MEKCPHCGASVADLTGGAALHLIIDTDIGILLSFFVLVLDEVRCSVETCKRALAAQPGFIVKFEDSGLVLCTKGTGGRPNRDTISRFIRERSEKEPFNTGFQELSSVSELRKAVFQQLAGRLGRVNEILGAVVDISTSAFVLDIWRELTPSFFSAGYLLCSGVFPGTKAQVPGARPDEVSEEMVRRLGVAQALSWSGLLRFWLEDTAGTFNLEDDLRRYIDPGTFIPGAHEEFLKLWDAVEDASELPLEARFCLGAVKASIFSALKKEPNPYEAAWASAFFDFEILSRVGSDQFPPQFKAMLIDHERAQQTLSYRAVWDNVLRRTSEPEEGLLDVLRAIASKAGYPELADKVLSEGRKIQPKNIDDDITVDEICSGLRSVALESVRKADLFNAIDYYFIRLVETGRIDDLSELADRLIEDFGGTELARAQVEIWLGKHLKEARYPQVFLNRVGEAGRSWEPALPPGLKAPLWTERSNAFRLCGHPDKALYWLEKALAVLSDPDDRADIRVGILNKAILLRELGSPDAALSLMNGLLLEAVEDERIGILNSLCCTYAQVGWFSEAAKCSDEAVDLATGPWARYSPLLKANRAGILVAAGRYEEAIDTLMDRGADRLGDPSQRRERLLQQVSEAAAWATLLRLAVKLPDEGHRIIRALILDLERAAQESESDGDIRAHLGAQRANAILSEEAGLPDSEARWRRTYEAYRSHKQVQDPEVLASLARCAMRRDDMEQGRIYLKSLPVALAAKVGAVTDLGAVVEGLNRLKGILCEILELLMKRQSGSPQSFEDIRLVAELGREGITRARIIRNGANYGQSEEVFDGPSDAELSRLAPRTDILAVLEWMSDGQFSPLLTIITSEGCVSSHWLPTPLVDQVAAATKVRQRLTNWRPGRVGEPLDIDEWLKLEDWFIQSVAPYLETASHVIFIETEEIAGLPWHVAARSVCTSSYAPSWSTLVALDGPQSRPPTNTVGIVLVPRSHEAEELRRVLWQSSERTRSFASGLGLEVLSGTGGNCDYEVCRTILEAVDVAKLLCHGFVDSAAGEIALMLAHDGTLPLANSVASASISGVVHRLNWRDCQSFTKAPRLIFSAACSSGVSRITGLGERLGLYSAFHASGTKAMVAPKWDIVAESVLPILDETLEAHIGSGLPLALSLRNACSAAERHCPRWLAWALAVEGDWR